MSNLKRFTFIVVSVMVVVWSMGGVFVNMANAATPVAGDLIKMTGSNAVYYFDGTKRYVFPMENIYKTWYTDFNNVVTITPTEMGNITIGGNVTVRPGTWLVKITTDPKVYVVTPGGVLHWLDSEARAIKLYGAEWYKKVIDVRDDLFVNYTVGSAISSDQHPVGTLIKYASSTQVYYVDSGNVKRPVASEATMTANNFQSKFVVTTDISYTDGSSVTGKESALSNPAGSSTPTPVSGEVSVSLASDTPVSGTVVAGQAIADLGHLKFTNGTTSELKVTGVTLQRLGVSADTTLSAVYLYDGVSRLSDAASVSSGIISFNDSTGLFTLAAGASKVIAVKSNITASTSGQTVGVGLLAANKVVTSPAATITGSFPVNSNIHTVASATMATIDFNSTTTPASATISPQDGYTMWQNVITVGERKVYMSSFKLRQIGSVNTSDLANFKLYVDGVQKGTTVTSLDANGYVTWDLSSSPVTLETGSRTIKVVGDIVNGSNRNFSFSLRQAADAMFTDSEFNQPVLATAASSSFSARTTGTETIDTGVLTFTKKTDSPSGNVVNTASNVPLAKYEVKASGESMKVESLRVRIDEDDGDTAYTLRNGALYLDGVQVGSTAAIAGDTDSTQAYTEYTFGSSFIVTPGTTRVLEVRADIYDSDGANNVSANDTIQVELGAGSNNVQRMTSLGYGTYPASYSEANTLTVATGSLTVAKNTTYANQSIVAPKYGYKIGSYNIQANATEGANITSLVFDFDTVTDAFDASDDITNLYVKVGSYTSNVKSTVTDTANTFSTNININAGQTLVVELYGDIATSSTDGDGTADTAVSSLTVSYTTNASSTSTSASEVTGQTITSTTGTFTVSVDGSTPNNRIVAGDQKVEAAKFKFQATNETYYIKELSISVPTATVGSAVSEVQVYDGSNPVATGGSLITDDGDSGTNNTAYFTGLNYQVPANTNKVLTVYFVLNTIGTGAGTSQVNAVAQLDRTLYADSSGTETTLTTDYTANELYVYKSIPVVTQVDLTNSTVSNGQPKELYKFTVAASSKGAVSLKQFTLPISWNDGGTTAGDTLEIESIKLFEDGVDITSDVVIQDQAGNSVESTSGLLEADTALTISWATTKEGVVAAGTTKTYVIKGTPTGFNATDADANPTDSFSLYLAGDSAHNSTKIYLNGTATATTLWGLHTAAAATGSGTAYNFIWSDQNLSNHAVAENASSSADWANGYKVLNLDLDTELWAD